MNLKNIIFFGCVSFFLGVGILLGADELDVICLYKNSNSELSVVRQTRKDWDDKDGIQSLVVVMKNLRTGTESYSSKFAGMLMGCLVEGLASAVEKKSIILDHGNEWNVTFKGKGLGVTISRLDAMGDWSRIDLSRSEALEIVRKIGSHFEFSISGDGPKSTKSAE